MSLCEFVNVMLIAMMSWNDTAVKFKMQLAN